MELKKGILFFIVFLFITLCSSCAYAHAGDKVKRVETKVEIEKNGNAIVTEDWYINLFDGYSYFKFYKNVEPDEIVNFSVVDEDGMQYENVGEWNLAMENEEKKNKCGIIYTDGDAALLWGIKSYGAHHYTLKYEVCDFVKKMFYSKGTKLNFLDAGIPTLCYVTISSDVYRFSDENEKLSDSGTLKEVQFLEDGSIYFETYTGHLMEDEFIRFRDDAPFVAEKWINGNKNVNLRKSNEMKPQDILVATITAVVSVLYVICDRYRNVYEHRKLKEKALAWENR